MPTPALRNLKRGDYLKKIILYGIFVIILIFTMPIVFTNQFQETQEVSTEETKGTFEKANYGDLSIIRLLHKDTNQVEEIEFDPYLYGVVSAEMPASYELEALRAQAVVARTYTIYKIVNGSKHENADICDSSLCCQAWISKESRLARWEDEKREEYWNKIVNAVDSTSGRYVSYQGQPINAFFHSNSGGITELPVNVWGGSYPYLQVVATSGEENYTGYSSEIQVSKDELIQKMLEKYSNFQINFEEVNCIQILDLTESGRVKTMKIGNVSLSGVEARAIFGLKSAKFGFEMNGDWVKFTVTGYGHGVGLSQTGADSLAKQGRTYEEIVKHYYRDVEIK